MSTPPSKDSTVKALSSTSAFPPRIEEVEMKYLGSEGQDDVRI
jgi:hypothetical protein